jgi:hypothetical protein
MLYVCKKISAKIWRIASTKKNAKGLKNRFVTKAFPIKRKN